MRVEVFQKFACSSHARSTLALLIPLICACFISLATAQSETVLSPEHIEQRLKALNDDNAADDNEVVTTYQQAASFLGAADSFNRDAANYADAMISEPLREAAIQARIDTFQVQVDPAEGLADLTKVELESELAIRRSELNERSENLAKLDRRLTARESNVEDIRTRLGEIDTLISSLPDNPLLLDITAPPSLAEAERWRSTSEALALTAERRILQARLNGQPILYSAMTADRAESTMLIDDLSQQIRAIERLSREKVAELADTESLEIDTNNPIYAVATELVAMDAAVREEQIRLNEELNTVQSLTDDVERISHDVTDRFNTARRLVDFGGGSDGLGAVLTLYWDEIGNFALPYSKASFTREAGGTVIKRIQHEEILEKLVSATAYINQELEKAGINADTLSTADQEILLGLASSYRARLRATINAQSDYIEALRVLGDGYLKLTGQMSEYKKYLQSLILWIPDRSPLWNVSADSIPKEIAALKSAFENIKLSVKPALLFGLIGFALLWSFRARWHTFQLHLNTLIRRPRDDSTGNTGLALACIALRALPLPLLLVSIASLFSDQTVSTVLIDAGIALFVCNYVKLVCAPDGVGPVHFDWPEALAERIHREFGWLGRIVLPLAIIAFLIMGITVNTGDTVLGRIAVISVLALPLLSIISYLASHARKYGSSWLRLRNLQLRVALGLLLAMLIAAVVLGHSYSTRVILASLAESVLIGFCLLLVHGVLSRWITVTRRKLRLAELMAAKAEDGTLEDPEANLGDVSAETRELINVGTVITAFVILLYIWAPLLPALDAMTQVILWTSSTTVDGQTVESHFTLAALFKVVALVALTVYAARKLPALIELILRSRTSVSPSSRYTTIALLNYVIVGGGITMALSALGLQWSELQWLVAALGVGIGFGLQEIIANFISGLIILFERPIRVGDVISTGGNDGTVTRIRIRATAIRDWDGKELLVPNKEFITGRLLNWTLSDAKVRTVIPVGIAYGSDVELAIKTLHSAVSSHSRVIYDPPVQIIFEGFGDDALLLSARFYLDSLEDRLLAVTEINREIYRTLNDAGIVIAFPQRDVHFDSDKPIKIAFDKSEDGPARDA